jgi:hypothetical protein
MLGRKRIGELVLREGVRKWGPTVGLAQSIDERDAGRADELIDSVNRDDGGKLRAGKVVEAADATPRSRCAFHQST